MRRAALANLEHGPALPLPVCGSRQARDTPLPPAGSTPVDQAWLLSDPDYADLVDRIGRVDARVDIAMPLIECACYVVALVAVASVAQPVARAIWAVLS